MIIMDISREWHRSEFVRHESLNFHRPVEEELNEYIAIAQGNMEYVEQSLNTNSFKDPSGKGILSENELQNMRYHFVVSTALITRYCVMNGMELEKAYNLSDFYILTMDKCKTISEIVSLHDTMCRDYCQKMNILKKSEILSKPIVLCIDYIYRNLHSRITIKQLAEYTKLSESYLSRLFCKEMGMPVSTYTTLQKVEKAKNLLTYSNYSLSEIANYLAFSSQSHFIQIFQKYEGTTPRKYREQHFRNNWEDMSSKQNN